MFETTKVLIKNNTRNILKKMKEAPILYTVFIGMIIFSILIFGFTTFYIINFETKLDVSLNDVYFLVIFAFFFKSSYDFYNHFIKAENVTYALSTNVKQRKTIFEIFLGILLTNLIIWFSFSTLFLLSLIIFNVDIGYPLEYLIFTTGTIVGICLVCTVCINFFSLQRYRLLPTLILVGFYLYSNQPLFISLTLPIAILHAGWSINNAMSSHQFIRRKNREKKK